MSDINACTDDLRVKLNDLRDNAAAKGSVDDATIATDRSHGINTSS